MNSFGVVVRMVKVSTLSPSRGPQLSHSPANENGSPFFSVISRGLSRVGHSKDPSATTRQRRELNACRKAGLVPQVSDWALIIRDPIFTLYAQNGTSPQRNS